MAATQQAKTKAMANGAKSSRPMEKPKGEKSMAKKMKGDKKMGKGKGAKPKDDKAPVFGKKPNPKKKK